MATSKANSGDESFLDDLEWNPSANAGETPLSSLDASWLAPKKPPRRPTPISKPSAQASFTNEQTRVKPVSPIEVENPVRPQSKSPTRLVEPPSGAGLGPIKGVDRYTRMKKNSQLDDFSVDDFSTGFELNEPRSDDSLDSLLTPFEKSTPKVERVAPPTRGGKDARPARPAISQTAVVGAEKAGRKSRQSPIKFPKTGEMIGGFRIVREIGRGAFARVYQAQEVALGDRPVALKVSRAEGDEPRVLARFQHTHIVPIYSVNDDPKTRLRLMCMPYFGGADLSRLLDAAQEFVVGDAQGRSLVEALDRLGTPFKAPEVESIPVAKTKVNPPSEPAAVAESDVATLVRFDPSQIQLRAVSQTTDGHQAKASVRSFFRRLPFWSQVEDPAQRSGTSGRIDQADEPIQPNRVFLRGTTFVKASVWIVEKLAEGLDHAHSRGYLHRDLKPSNILIAADGTPMLLDFNLAAHAYDSGMEGGEKAKLGGTLPYMAPEHLDAFNPDGKTRAEMVDERSDLYALGLILFEMISGQHPFPSSSEDLSTLDTLKAMIQQRRGPAPSLRQANPGVPWSLDAIVRKCMDPDPALRYRSASQFGEELRNFLDDRPLQFTKEPSLKESVSKWARRHPRLSSGSSVGLISTCILLALGMTASTISGSLKQTAARLNLRVHEPIFQECQFLLNTSSGSGLADHQKKGILKAKEIRDRFNLGTKGDWTRLPLVASLSPDEQTEIRRSMAELILLEARARVALAKSEGERAHREALNWAVSWLDEVEKFEPEPTNSLHAERARYHAALGDAAEATKDRLRASQIPLKTCRDLYLTATSELAQGHTDSAETFLNEALAIDPRRYWTWFALGMCHLEQKRYAESANDFAFCSYILPKFAWSYLNRGVALAKLGRLPEARLAYDRAIAVSPQFNEALVQRGLVSLELSDPVQAEADFSKAISLGRGDPLVRAGLAESLAKQHRDGEAVLVLNRLIDNHPDDPRWRVTRGMMVLRTDARSAETDFRAALKLDPDLALAHLGLARSLRGRDPAEALKQADLAVKADPGLIDAIEFRMLLLAQAGKIEAKAEADRLLLTPTPRRIYNAACALALLGGSQKDPAILDQAVATLQRAFAAGFPREQAGADPDLKAIAGRW